MLNAYYCTQRPAGPGAVPKDKLLEVVDLNGTVIDERGTRAYSIVLYNRALSFREIEDYELRFSGFSVSPSYIRELCVKKGWCNACTNDSYEQLLSGVEHVDGFPRYTETIWSLEELSLIIMICTIGGGTADGPSRCGIEREILADWRERVTAAHR